MPDTPRTAPSLDFVHRIDRRGFFRLTAAGAAGLAVGGSLLAQPKKESADIATNIADIVEAHPRTAASMPGAYPGRVVTVSAPGACTDGVVDAARARAAVERGLTALTGDDDAAAAWRRFAGEDDVVGIKVNPIGGALLSTRVEVVDAVIAGLLAAGVKKSNIVIWDRRLFQLEAAGFTAERFPGIEIAGTEMEGPNGSFWDDEGRLWSRDNVDRDAPAYVADVEMEYDKETMPYMVNQGRESYFASLLTRRFTKVVNVPVLKNAGPSVTLCMKNLSYGSLSNTARLHKLWAKSVAEPLAFPCLRDKVVLNVADGLRACYDGGPRAVPQYIFDANVVMVGTDPVAVDTAAYDMILAKRLAEGAIKAEDPRGRQCLEIAAALGLGRTENLDRVEVALPA